MKQIETYNSFLPKQKAKIYRCGEDLLGIKLKILTVRLLVCIFFTEEYNKNGKWERPIQIQKLLGWANDFFLCC